ncbi:MAG: TlpA disulfide reductase family protein [Gemmatimonadaceae bacterium]
MTAKQQWMVVAVVVALMGGGLAAGSYLLRDELRPLMVGNKAPIFVAGTVDATPVTKSFAAYKGEVVLLNVWATFCGPCRVEMPSIEALYKDFKPKGLKVVAVSVDEPGKLQAIRDFVKEFNLSFEILYDSTGTIEKQYQTTGYPESFVIGRDGTIHKKFIGADDWNSPGNRKLIEMLLAEPAR